MKISKRVIISFLSAMAFFQPARYVIGDIITRMWNWYVIGVSLIYITLYILVYTRRRITKADIGIIAMLGVFVYSFLIASLFNSTFPA